MAKKTVPVSKPVKVRLANPGTHRCGFGECGGPARSYSYGKEYTFTKSEWALAKKYRDHKGRNVFVLVEESGITKNPTATRAKGTTKKD